MCIRDRYEVMHGTNSAVMLRGAQAWMYKEADAPLIGWEVYARKMPHYGTPGVVLAAGAPTLGMHNREIFSKLLGLDESQITSLKESGVI